MSQSQIKIDDQDLSLVKYNGTWIRGGSPNEYDGTVASSTNVGDSFSVSFTGTLISVYGTIDSTSGGVLTNYSVDGASPSQATSQAGAGDTYRQQFWNSPILNEGTHELLVTMVKVNPDSQAGEGTIWFDFFLVTNPLIQSNNSTTKSKPIGAIVGGVVGGTVFLLVVVLALVRFLRCRKKRLALIQPWSNKEVQSDDSCPSSHPIVEPFRREETNSAVASTTATHKPALSITSLSTSPSSVTSPLTSVISSNPVSSKRQRDPMMLPGSSRSLSEPAIQHVDSGVRVANLDPAQTSGAQVELPPVYSPV